MIETFEQQFGVTLEEEDFEAFGVISMSKFISPLSVPHIGADEMRKVEIVGKYFHFFVLEEFLGAPSAPLLLNSLYLRLSEVIEAVEGCSSQAIQALLAHLKALHAGDELHIPEYVWLDDKWQPHAITPVPLHEALSFWCQQSNTRDH